MISECCGKAYLMMKIKFLIDMVNHHSSHTKNCIMESNCKTVENLLIADHIDYKIEMRIRHK